MQSYRQPEAYINVQCTACRIQCSIRWMDELQILYGRGKGTNVISKFYACRRFCCSLTILDCHKIARETSCNAHFFLLLCLDEYFFYLKKTVHSLILLYNLTYLIPRRREKIPFHFVKLSFKSIADVNEKIFSTEIVFFMKTTETTSANTLENDAKLNNKRNICM